MRWTTAPDDRLVFAHRGGARLAPENTMAAFANGLLLGSDGLECDVHLARDGVPVVIHDGTLDRTTNATGRVADRTALELATVDAGYQFRNLAGQPEFRGRGIGVPTLEELLRAFPVRTIIEMKDGSSALARAVVNTIARTGAGDRVCVGSFHHGGLCALRRLDRGVATSASEPEVRWALYRSWCRWPWHARRAYGAFQVPERAGRVRVVSPAFVRHAHREHQRVDVWVIDRAEDMERLFSWDVDGVITDRPDVAVSVRDRVGRRRDR
jgi:glycerophosphoryl diester phosphodiesterase